MFPLFRGQDSLDAEAVSAAVVISCPVDDEITRQEFAKDADVNVLLRRFGAVPPMRGDPRFVEVDFSTDLLSAYGAVERARAAYAELPARIRDLYPNWQAVVEALHSGQLGVGPVPSPEVPSGDGAGSPAVGTAPPVVPAV